MLINYLELNNIGPYEGSNTFQLKTDKHRNTILIGGKNGSGKTTFLNSVRLALYGPLAFGFKTPTQRYLKNVEDLLNNRAKKDRYNNNFYIKIGFKTVEEFKLTNIEIIRSWTPSESTIKEVVNIIRDNQPLNEIEKDNFMSKLRVSFPPSLLELCFFDGEDIASLTDDRNLSNYLHELSEKLFNLDLFSSLERNLKQYITENTQSKNEVQLEDDRNKIKLQLDNKTNELEKIKKQIQILMEKLDETKTNYKQIKKEFSTHGGLLLYEREEIQKEILNLENKRKKINDYIKDFIAHELPFFLSYPLVKELVNQLNEEESFHISSIIDEKLNQFSFKELENVLNIELDDHKAQRLLDLLKNTLSGSNDDLNIIHNASKTETHQVHALLELLNIERLNTINSLIDSNNEDLEKLYSLNKKLKNHQNTSEFKDMILSMEQYSKEISEIETKINELFELQEKLHEEVEDITKQYEKVEKELYNIYKEKSSYDLTRKIINVSEKFQQSQLRKKVQDIEYFSTRMLRELIRKKNFIKQIYIDSETFDINLVNFEEQHINKNILSAGEKELLILSIIWGTIQASNKQIPFVLDTLLGRLDLEHKSAIINKLIPRFGKQIIILSTNSEITEDLFVDLSPYISNNYTLNFDQDEERTRIENHFFNHRLKEVHT